MDIALVQFPCKNCGDRKFGCHSECEKYKQALASNKEKRQKQEQSKYSVYDEYHAHRIAVVKRIKLNKQKGV